jgi:hypothetical protein
MHRNDHDLTAHSLDNFARPSRFVRDRHRRVIKTTLIGQP